MTSLSLRILYWLPRLLGIAFILFISLFALDAFNEGFSARALGGFLMHLRLSFVVAVLLIVAWRHEWVGAICFSLGAAYYLWTVLPRTDLGPGVKLNWSLVIAGPAFVIAVLFWLNWLARKGMGAQQD